METRTHPPLRIGRALGWGLAGLVLAGFLLTRARAGEPASVEPGALTPHVWSVPGPDELAQPTVCYLRLTMAGAHAGGAGTWEGVLADGRRLQCSRLALRVTRDGDNVFHSEQVTRTLLDAAGRPLRAEQVDVQAGVRRVVHTVWSADEIEVTHEGPGGTYTRRSPLPAHHGSLDATLRKLLAQRVEGQEARATFATFDDDDGVWEDCVVTLKGRATYEHGGLPVDAFRAEARQGGLDIVLLVDEQAQPWFIDMGGVFEGRRVDAPAFDVAAGGGALASEIPLSGPIERPQDLEALDLVLTLGRPLAADAPSPLLTTARQSVERIGEAYRIALRHDRLPDGFQAARLPLADPAADLAPYLAATQDAQADHPDLVARARQLAAGSDDALVVTRRIVGWVQRHMRRDLPGRAAATALEVLHSGEGDCTEHAVLVVGLCRAAGIPARTVGGILCTSTRDGRPLAGFHAWTEVWVGRWLWVDATFGTTGTPAGYIQLDVEGGGRDGPQVARLLPTYAPRLAVVGFQHVGEERRAVAPATDEAAPREVPAGR